MPGLEEDCAIRARIVITPLRPAEHGGEEDGRATVTDPGLVGNEATKFGGTGGRTHQVELVTIRRVAIEPRRHACNAENGDVGFDRVPGARRRRHRDRHLFESRHLQPVGYPAREPEQMGDSRS